MFTFDMVKSKALNIALHIVCWIVFLSIPHYFFSYVMHIVHVGHEAPAGTMPPQGPPPSWFNLAVIAFNASFIVFYYLNSFVLIPRLLTRRYRLWYVLSVLLSLMIILTLPSVVFHFHHHHTHTHPPHPHDEEYHSFILLIRILFTSLLFAIIFIVSTGLRILREWYRAEQLSRDIQHEKTVTELSLLKAQINPHFLFNTLNNIYSLSVRHSDDAPQAVMMLADMMRYVLTDAQRDLVPLDKDLAYISEYIRLQKLRLTDRVTIDYTVTGDPTRHEIAPLMLIPFVENAFKYGISTHEPSTISVYLAIADSELTVLVTNPLLPQAHQMQQATGTGLANVRRRLELLYPGRHTLIIDPDDHGTYRVSLHLKLT